MPRIQAPAIETAPEASRPLLEAVKKKLGSAPNLFRTVANSPAALKGYLDLSDALSHGTLDAATRERIALTVAEQNGCDYCLAAHTYIGSKVQKLTEEEVAANRAGTSTADARTAAIVRFAQQVVVNRGHVADTDLDAVRAAGVSEGDIVQIVVEVALNTLTNYVNEVSKTIVDFPAVRAPGRAAA